MLCLDEFGVEHELETDLDRYERDFLSYSWEELVDLYDLKDQDKVVFEYKGKNEFENIFVIHAEKLPELGSFTTNHIPETIYGEVDPKFATKFSEVLPSVWKVYVENKQDITLDYNQNCENPLLHGNWPRLREIYKFRGVKKLSFTYIGTNKFRLSILDEIEDGEPLPKLAYEILLKCI
ncbi:hypothetical protein QL285_060849 [Trifolium repens]|nr:hypothetical protein QL285_060849 [Trifolium repens]